MKRIPQLLLLVVIASTTATGQINCASGGAANKLVCEFPFATGAFANSTALGTGPQTGSNNAQTVATGINTAVATQVSQLPLAAASAGSVVTFKSGPNGPVPVVINDLGPILTDRAQTIGKHLFLGFTASQFVFTDIDGNSLSNLKWAAVRTAYDSNQNVVSNTYTTETVQLSFKINQFVSVATVGLHKNVDVTVVVPASRISLSANTTNIQNYVLDTNGNQFTYTTPSSSTVGTASGIGDIVLNVKCRVQEWEHDAIAISGNLRTPTGDSLNFLGSGSWGLNPYLLYSHAGKISPHMKVGYQWNTRTGLNNASGKFRGNSVLPGGLQYDIGIDWAAKHKVTLVADLLGNQFQNVSKLVIQDIIIPNLTQVTQTTSTVSSTYTVSNVATGLKWGPVGGLVLSANVLTQINNVGLRSRPTPMLGIAYRF
jgi:hypothetical protein